MSYDIYLRDQIRGDVIRLADPSICTGGFYCAHYDISSSTWSTHPITDAWLKVTENYSDYYYEAAEGDERFIKPNQYNGRVENVGIRGIYGEIAVESAEMIRDLINRIIEKYSDINGWKTTKRVTRIYYDSKGNEVDFRKNLFIKEKYTYEEFTTDVYEGPNANYWTATAANAIVPLYQLLVFAKLRPDGIWDGS